MEHQIDICQLFDISRLFNKRNFGDGFFIYKIFKNEISREPIKFRVIEV